MGFTAYSLIEQVAGNAQRITSELKGRGEKNMVKNYKHVKIPNKPNSNDELLDSCIPCPICESENLHIVEVQVHRDVDIITITKEKIHVDSLDNTGRGTYVNIKYMGECGHWGRIILHFYKGNTFVFNEPLGELSKWQKEHGAPAWDIFRD
jgi:hypothetical protein